MKNLSIGFSILLIGFISCNKEIAENDKSYFLSEMPGIQMFDMALDRNNAFYFVSGETDESIEVPLHSNCLPIRLYLSKKNNESSDFEVLNDHFYGGKLFFDRNNQLWIMTGTAVYRFDGAQYHQMIELSSGLLNFLTVDMDNNIWTGGFQTGLYKFDNQLNVTHFTAENSKLPTNSMTNIHIDKDNNKWIALWDYQGVLKISDTSWNIYNSNNSNICSGQNIWCLVTDKNGHLWLGTGWDDSEVLLMRYDGANWETINPKNDKNETVRGAVRQLYSDGNKIYVVSDQSKNMELSTFDGTKWEKVYGFPEDDGIGKLIMDQYRQVVWITTLNKGVFKKRMD